MLDMVRNDDVKTKRAAVEAAETAFAAVKPKAARISLSWGAGPWMGSAVANRGEDAVAPAVSAAGAALVHALNDLAHATYAADDHEATLRTHLRAIAVAGEAALDDTAKLLWALENVGTHFARQQRFDRAVPLFGRSLKLREAMHGATSPAIAEPLRRYGFALFQLRQLDRAAEILARAAAFATAETPPAARATGMTAQVALAEVLIAAGKPDAAESHLMQTMRLAIQTGSEIVLLGVALDDLAKIFAARGQEAQAIGVQQLAVMLLRRLRGDAPLEFAAACNNLALALGRAGRFDEAEAHFGEALATFEERFGKEHWTATRVAENIGRVRARQQPVAA